MASDTTTVAYIYKRVYDDKSVADMAMRDHPFFNMVPKKDVPFGANQYYSIKYGNPQGISNTFSTAQTNSENSRGVQLAVGSRQKYGVITLDGVSMAKAEGNKGAMMELVTLETDSVLEEMGDDLAFELYRNGDGDRGRRSSASTNVITLTDAEDARNFKVGMTVVADNNQTGASLRTGSTTVTEVDEDAGTVTLTSAAAITSFADNDYLFRQGSVNDSCIEGMAVLFPLTAPSSGESWRGIDRSVHTRLLAGIRVDDTSTPIEENLGLVATKIKQASKKSANVCFLNPIKFWEVARRLNAKVTYDGGGLKAAYGFEGIDVHTSAGVIRIVSDPDAPANRGRVTRLDTLCVYHRRAFPHLIREDGLVKLRSASADSFETRARSIANLISYQPGASGVFSIA